MGIEVISRRRHVYLSSPKSERYHGAAAPTPTSSRRAREPDRPQVDSIAAPSTPGSRNLQGLRSAFLFHAASSSEN